MNARLGLASFFIVALCACDKDPAATPDASVSAPVSASAPPVASSPPDTTATPSASASAAPASSTSQITGADSDDVILTMKDPSKEPEKTMKAKAGGSFTLFMPDVQGADANSWAADSVGSLGKPKEEVIPGFAKNTLGHQFKWTGLKAGKTKATFGSRKPGTKGGAPTATFTLNLEVN